MNKKGLSDVISTVLLILLVISAIAILWIVIQNFISSSSESIEVGTNSASLEITNAQYGPNGLEVNVKKSTAGGDVSGINLILDDEQGNSKSYILNTPIQILETKTIILSSSQIIALGILAGNITRIGVYPMINTSKGRQVSGKIRNEFSI